MGSREIGTLVVVVLKAQHLHQPSFYKQDPYAQATLSGLKKRTNIAPKGGQHPVWDDELRFPILADVGKDKANRNLEIACYKDEQRGDDVLLGKGTVDIEETLKTGEFDDWVPLETSAGVRGEIYLEMTFYANAPPPVTRRPSKLTPSDRLTRPTQSQQSTLKSSSIPSSHSGHLPAIQEGKSTQPPSTSGGQIPASLIPAHGSKGQGQGSKQRPPNGSVASTITTVKRKDEALPPLPTHDASDTGPRGNPGLPAALHSGGHSGPRPIPPQDQNRVTSMGRPPAHILPEQLHRRTLSDTPVTYAPWSSPQMQQSYSSDVTGTRVGLPPSIQVEEHLYPPVIPRPITDSPVPTQSYLQPNSQAFIPNPTGSRTLSPQPPMPPHSPYAPLGQPQQYYDTSPTASSPPFHHQQYTQYPNGPMTPQPLSSSPAYPRTQPQQQSVPYSSQQPPYSTRTQQPSPYQNPYTTPQQQQQQQYPQYFPYIHPPHTLQVLRPYQQHDHGILPPSSRSAIVPQQPSHSQSLFTVPPPPPIQSQTPNAYTQTPHQPQLYFSPPPPPPPLYNQAGKEPLVSPSVSQSSQALAPPLAFTQEPPPLLGLPATQSLPPVVLNTLPAPNTEDVAGQVEDKRNRAESIVFAETGAKVQELKEVLEDVGGKQATENQNTKSIAKEMSEQGPSEHARGQGANEGDAPHRVEEERCRKEEMEKQKEGYVRQQEDNRCRQECGQQETEGPKRQGEEEQRREMRRGQERARGEEEHRRREEEEHQRQEELRNEEERRKQEEEHERREREECKRREDEERMRKEELRKQEEAERKRREEEEHRKQEEAERKRREEEEHRKQEEAEHKRREEEEHRKQEEERIQRAREEAVRRRKEADADAQRRRAEEAEAERRWQEELARIKARAEQEAADAAFARAQIEEEEAERRKQEEADLALVRREQEEAERRERLARERRRQEEADREVARREQAHEEELERRRTEERRRRMEEADRELARKLDMELNMSI